MPDLGSQALQSNAGGGIGPIRGSPEIAVQQTETLDMIQNIVKGLHDHGNNAKELKQIAQPLFQIPKEERWPAAVVLVLTSFQQWTGGSLPMQDPRAIGQ
ncbi:hypothetical protein Pst134EB_021933 [Puccinia striiformis f. sp. tritici]|nr:hypothetical protein Pst134EB_021933 [Puccinia striiformis f. sp. tritici]